jgi:hypothetical protein
MPTGRAEDGAVASYVRVNSELPSLSAMPRPSLLSTWDTREERITLTERDRDSYELHDYLPPDELGF